ncbi:MAG: hypothetical protein H0W36_15645 [Gemmatimonadetes bacterium]|nr:hypothetical protein [Gemmatimonadota bacterium]MBA3587059.1 hypothetical protein [Chloroflexota bacterium]
MVLDRIISGDGGQERLPPGDYVLTAYYRACDVLDPAESFCSLDAVLAPKDSLQLVISVSQRSCEVSQRG